MIHASEKYNIQPLDEMIPANEPVFLLRGCDELSAMTIEYWVGLAKENGIHTDKLEAVTKHIEAVKDWPKKTRIVQPIPSEEAPIE